MVKEEGSRLLSKVARFVRNPLRDWSELDGDEATGPDSLGPGFNREALKAMVERRQRNDLIRRREFENLRRERRQQAEAAGPESEMPASSFPATRAGAVTRRAQTLRKIDEIEAQMSQQWWTNPPAAPEAVIGGSRPEEPLAVQHARAYADTVPADATHMLSGLLPMLPPDRLAQAAATPLAQAALRFANHDDAGAEALLLEAVADDSPGADDPENWRGLLDLYRATGDAQKFAAASERYTQRTGHAGPEWVSLRMLAHAASQPPSAGGEDAPHWRCPERLDRHGLIALTQALSGAGAVWRLDWQMLREIDAAAVPALTSLMTHWGNSPVQLRFAGARQLVGTLQAITPLGERSTDPSCWHLYLAVLRVLHRVDDFELVALNYCITYEISPPPWQDPVGACQPLHASADAARAPGTELVGELTGGAPQVWPRLSERLAAQPTDTLSCAALVRMDTDSAQGLLQWLGSRPPGSPRLALVELHRLLLALLRLVGVQDVAQLTPRD